MQQEKEEPALVHTEVSELVLFFEDEVDQEFDKIFINADIVLNNDKVADAMGEIGQDGEIELLFFQLVQVGC